MKYCSACLEEVEMYADEVGELCEHCVDDLIIQEQSEVVG